jgi:hypothetical protein
MALDSNGIATVTLRVIRVDVSTCPGTTSDSAG